VTTDHDDVDRRIRAAFEPDPAVVEEVIAASASGRRVSSSRRGSRAMLVAAAAGLMALTAAGFWARGPARSAVSPGNGGIDAWFDDEVLVMPLPDGSVSLVGPGGRDDRPADGDGIVLVLGDEQ